MKGKRIREITDGSIIVALYGMIFLLSRFTGGQVEYTFSFIMPLPLAIYGYKYNFKKSLIPFTATVILSFFLSANPFNGLFVVLPITFSGCILGGILIKKKIRPVYSILIMGMFSALVEVLSSILFSQLLGIDNILIDISNILNEFENLININGEDFVIIQALLEGLIPSIIIIISIMSSLTSYLIFIVLIKRIFKEDLNKEILQFFSLNSFFPKSFTIGYCLVIILSIIALICFRYVDSVIRILFVILINISLIIGMIYFYFGLKVFALIIRLTNKKYLLIFELIMIVFLPFIFVLVGILDNILGLQIKIYNKIVNTDQN